METDTHDLVVAEPQSPPWTQKALLEDRSRPFIRFPVSPVEGMTTPGISIVYGYQVRCPWVEKGIMPATILAPKTDECSEFVPL
jgi:hypothetical protein